MVFMSFGSMLYFWTKTQCFPSESTPPNRSGVWFFRNLGLEKEALFVRALDVRS